MYQDQRNRCGRRRGVLGCKPSGHVSGAPLVNGPVAPNGCKAPATKPSERTPAVTLNGTKVQFMVNGYIKGKSTKTFRTLAATEAVAAGRENDGEAPVRSSVRSSVRGVSDPAAHARAHKCEQVTPEQRLPSAMQNKRKRKKFKRTKREEENWENEIQEVSLGVETYGPEDVLQLGLQDLTLQQRDTCDLLATARYSPAAHHPRPVHWVRRRIPTEPDQFADAEDAVGPLGCARLQTMVSPTMKAVVDAVWAVWSIGASIYDYIHTNAMEERIHALENVITVHQCVIGLLSAGVLALFTYILFKKL